MATTRKTTSSSESAAGRATKKAPAKKSAPAKKAAPAKKSASAKKSAPAQKSAPAGTSASAEPRRAREPREAQEPAPKKVPAMKVARSAAQQLVALTGRAAESVIGIQRTEDGWLVELEVVESRRIPDSTDILATYQVETDEDGDLTGYHRVRRYVRGKGGDGEGGGR